MTTNVIPQLKSTYLAGNVNSNQRKSAFDELEFSNIMNQTSGHQIETKEAINKENIVSVTNTVEEKEINDKVKMSSDKIENEDSSVGHVSQEEQVKPDDIFCLSELQQKIENLDPGQVIETLSAFSTKIKELFIDNFQISEEDLTKAMEILGFGYLELLNPQNLSKLALSLTGSEDIMSLVASEEICANYMNLLEQVSELTETTSTSLQLEPEELVQIANMMNEDSFEKTFNKIPDALLEEVKMPEEALPVSLKNEPGYVLKKQTLTADENVITVENELDVEPESLEGTKITSEPKEARVYSEQEFTVENEPKEIFTEDEKSGADFSSSDSLADNVTSQQGIKNIVQNAEYPEQQINTEDIIRQIVDEIKVTVKVNTNTTSMELQLNPEKLGKLTIHLSSKEEVVTAQIIAQNNAVKEALEGQIAELRENLNTQGVKVDAIEVTVESHEFEGNLNQNSTSSNGSEQSEKHGRRQINLADFMEEQSDFSEEEILTADIMLQNGNNVDYTA